MLKQMSEKGAEAKKNWSSSRSSSGEGPDEVGSVDGHHIENEPLSPSYDTSVATAAATTSNTATNTTSNTTATGQFSNQQYPQQESFSLVNTNVPEPSTTRVDHKSEELESSESRKLVAEADDLKSRLRELNIGSFSLDGQDG